MLTALRNAAAPALRAWIDAHAIEILYAAAPANVGFMDPTLVEIADKIRKRTGSAPAAWALTEIGRAVGATVEAQARRFPLESRAEDYLVFPEDAGLIGRFEIRAPRMERAVTPSGEQVTRIGADGATARVPGVVVTLPGHAPLFMVYTGSYWDTITDEVGFYRLKNLAVPVPKMLPGALYAGLSTEHGRALVAALLNKVTPAEEKARAARAKRAALLREANRGSCPVCFRAIALSEGGTLAAHGWEMDGYRGHGHAGMYRTSGGCPGAHYQPWEASPAGARDYAEAMRGQAASSLTEAERRDRGEITQPIRVVTLRGQTYLYEAATENTRARGTVESLTPDDPRWAKWNATLATAARDFAENALHTAEKYDDVVRRWPIPATDAHRFIFSGK